LIGAAGGAVKVAAKGVFSRFTGWLRSLRKVDIPAIIYREGTPSPSNLKLRPGEEALSFRDSLSNPIPKGERPVLRPGKNYIGIDTSKLPPGSVVPDGVPGSAVTPPGHVSVTATPEQLKDAVVERGKFPK